MDIRAFKIICKNDVVEVYISINDIIDWISDECFTDKLSTLEFKQFILGQLSITNKDVLNINQTN